MFGKLLGVALVALVIYAVAAHTSSGAGHTRVYVVKPYDTLWSIAAKQYGGDPRDGVWKLRERNHLDNALVRPGQRLVLP
ncbi:MAG: LysM peptidoglycan-binding domain-containing protein [Actinomycetota bacterium]|nr:LysM peptidoglycan-binding domain-containing protein [Actinomycetota bacterium]